MEIETALLRQVGQRATLVCEILGDIIRAEASQQQQQKPSQKSKARADQYQRAVDAVESLTAVALAPAFNAAMSGAVVVPRVPTFEPSVFLSTTVSDGVTRARRDHLIAADQSKGSPRSITDQPDSAVIEANNARVLNTLIYFDAAEDRLANQLSQARPRGGKGGKQALASMSSADRRSRWESLMLH
ncbi:MAG: hypothetical protein MHM6MM_006214 [Cercozoa sp. M6MM]